MKAERKKELESQALKVREHIIRMSTDGGCFTGASLSCTDLVVYLYNEFLQIGPSMFDNPKRDYLLLSKGHDVPALYGLFVELGWLDKSRLANHLKSNDTIYWHPNRQIPGIEYYSGSLGHLPSVAVGIALDIKMRGDANRVVVITGDGELNEGTVWEAVLVAQAYKLDNLIFLVDRNHFQANIRTEDLLPLEPLQQKFESFGCAVKRINGHQFDEMADAFSSLPLSVGKPTVIIADTLRGKGLPSIQERADRWFCNFTHDEVEALIRELHGEEQARIHSETLIVR
ncbi:MAG: transketolase [Candidatus Competibacteraceae bacterium]|nr:transketolase [Candidatus Competibacteraceae bacterium]